MCRGYRYKVSKWLSMEEERLNLLSRDMTISPTTNTIIPALTVGVCTKVLLELRYIQVSCKSIYLLVWQYWGIHWQRRPEEPYWHCRWRTTLHGHTHTHTEWDSEIPCGNEGVDSRRGMNWLPCGNEGTADEGLQKMMSGSVLRKNCSWHA